MSTIENSVCLKILGRAEKGRQKYGHTMERKDLTTIEWLRHFQEEMMDGTIYVERLIQDLQALQANSHAHQLAALLAKAPQEVRPGLVGAVRSGETKDLHRSETVSASTSGGVVSRAVARLSSSSPKSAKGGGPSEPVWDKHGPAAPKQSPAGRVARRPLTCEGSCRGRGECIGAAVPVLVYGHGITVDKPHRYNYCATAARADRDAGFVVAMDWVTFKKHMDQGTR